MASVAPVPAARLSPGDFLADCKPDDLVYFLLNVGDGDSQVLLLPEDRVGRQALIVDIAKSAKTLALFEALEAGPTPLLPRRPDLIFALVATHPHEDHIGGIKRFLDQRHDQVEEIWEPGYYYPGPGYLEFMGAIEQYTLQHQQPTSGLTRYIGPVRVTVLAPGVRLRNMFDSYGVDPNNASICLKVEYPMNRYMERGADRAYVRLPKPRTLILGGDAQTLSWAQVQVDFPQLYKLDTAVAKALAKARGAEPLQAEIFKISHHGSKHGVGLELVELVNPKMSLISSDLTGSSYKFPHAVTLEQIREALEQTTKSGKRHSDDYELGIHYTCGVDTDGEPLGSMAIVISKGGRKRNLWRFGDAPSEPVDLAKARRFK